MGTGFKETTENISSTVEMQGGGRVVIRSRLIPLKGAVHPYNIFNTNEYMKVSRELVPKCSIAQKDVQPAVYWQWRCETNDL